MVRIEGKLVEGTLVVRDNRFLVTVDVEGERVWAHLADRGRLTELLVPGRRLVLVERRAMHRKTDYDVSLIEYNGVWVSLDTRLPNKLVGEAIEAGVIGQVTGYTSVRREVTKGKSRFDFLLEAGGRAPCLLEVKSASLVIDDVACFPDAVTARGRRHVLELADAVAEGYRAVVVFVVQRADARGLRPEDETDPEFGEALREAAARGVEVYAYGCDVEPGRVEIVRPLPVHLAPAH
ncbi:MAG TPA: DNA/RNA nuclease SfsA [Anaerolineae bacterium]|nr:DNA/RNA nuclease SfsA [Anaerolineae bacterium]